MADRNPGRLQLPRSNFSGVRQQPVQEAPESDPLAELARLIGQTDPQSNFARGHQPATPQPQADADNQTPGAPSWLQTAQANLQTDRADPPQDQAPDGHHGYDAADDAVLTPMPAFLRNAQPEPDASRYDEVLYGQQAPHSYADQYQDTRASGDGYSDEYREDDQYDNSPAFLNQEPKRRRGGMLTVAVVLGLAVIGTASAYGYRSYVGSPRSGTPPVFKADTSPTKVVPPTSQSADAGNKMFVDRIASGDGPERVVSREEQPVNVSAPRSVFPSPNQGQPVASLGQPGGAGGAPWDEPRKIRTVPIRSDQPTAAPQTTPATKQVATQPVTAPKPAAGQSPAPIVAGNGPMPLTPNNVRSASAAASSDTRSISAPAPVQTAAVNPSRGGFVVQIASQKSEAEAQASYKAAQQKYSNLLGSWSPIIKRADLAEKGVYYRAMVGPFATQEEAGQLCSNLKIAGGQCVVQRN